MTTNSDSKELQDAIECLGHAVLQLEQVNERLEEVLEAKRIAEDEVYKAKGNVDYTMGSVLGKSMGKPGSVLVTVREISEPSYTAHIDPDDIPY